MVGVVFICCAAPVSIVLAGVGLCYVGVGGCGRVNRVSSVSLAYLTIRVYGCLTDRSVCLDAVSRLVSVQH